VGKAARYEEKERKEWEKQYLTSVIGWYKKKDEGAKKSRVLTSGD